MNKYEEDPSELLKDQCVDAQQWAKAFMYTMGRDKALLVDEELMISWFAAAIENAKDWQYNRMKNE